MIKEISLRGMEDFEKINIAIRLWLLGSLDQKYIDDIIRGTPNSMFWTRLLGKIPNNIPLENDVCKNTIKNVLKLFQIGSIIIGHTPQSFMFSEDINSTCSGKVWRVDNGSSNAFSHFDSELKQTGKVSNSRRVQYLEILNDTEYYICDVMGCRRDRLS